MFPLRDENPSLTVPVVTRALIALNIAAFLYELALGRELSSMFAAYSLIPLRLTLALQGNEPIFAPALTLVTSMFLHGGWMHLIGNLWYLWIFGDNVEDRLGHFTFLLFYFGSGIAAGLLHSLIAYESRLPTVGASGAIAGVLGAYAAAFPGARVVTLLPLFPFFQVVALPALVLLGIWFAFQFLTLALGGSSAGVAWWAHIGGFAFGYAVMRIHIARGRPRGWV